MIVIITITGSVLHTPNETITDCWENRSTGLLSRQAGVALMPFMNEEQRQYEVWSAAFDAAQKVYQEGNVPPSMPDPIYTVLVDGESAIPVKEVNRDQIALFFDGDSEPTGRIYVHTIAETLRFLQ